MEELPHLLLLFYFINCIVFEWRYNMLMALRSIEKFTQTKIFRLADLSFIVALALLVPFNAQAALFGILDTVVRDIAKIIVAFFTFVPAFIFFIVAAITNWIIRITMDIGIIPGANGVPPFVQAGWEFSRQFVNMFFLLILAFIGLATILRLREYELQKTLPKLIVIALLVNFSSVFVGLIVDIGNLLTHFFLDAVGNFGSGTFSTIFTSASNAIDGIFDSNQELGYKFVTAMAFGIVLTLFFLFATLAYLLLAIIFFVRLVILWTIVILAPFAFAFYILPATRSWWNRWLSSLIQWAFVGAPIAFFMFLANMVLLTPLTPDENLKVSGLDNTDFWQLLIGSMLSPFVAIVLLFVGMGLALSMAPSSIRGVTKFARKAGAVAAGVLAANAITRLAESKKLRGGLERSSVSGGPKWGKNEDGTKKTGLGAWAQRTAASPFGTAQRSAGKLGTKAIIQADQKAVAKAEKKAANQTTAQNLSDLKASGTTDAERQAIVKTMAAKKQLRDARNKDIFGEGALKAEDLKGAHRHAVLTRDSDTTELIDRAFVDDKKAMQTFGTTYDQSTKTAQNQYADRTGGNLVNAKPDEHGKYTERLDEHGNAIALPLGVTSEEFDNGVTSLQAKTMKGTATAEEIAQLPKGWHNKKDENGKPYLLDAAQEFWTGSQMQQAAVRFGREFLNAFEASKKDKGIDWYLEPVPRGRNENGEIIYQPRNTSIPRWAANNAAQGLGVSPLEGAEGTTGVNNRTKVARQWAEQYNKVPGIQDNYKELMRILEEQRGIAHDESLPEEARPDDYKEALMLRKKVYRHDLGNLHDFMRAHTNENVRRLWEDTTKILKLPRMPFPPADKGGLNDMGMPASPRTGPSGGSGSSGTTQAGPASGSPPTPPPTAPSSSPSGTTRRTQRTTEERERRSPGRTRSEVVKRQKVEQLQTNPNFRRRFLDQLAYHQSLGDAPQIVEAEELLREAFGPNYEDVITRTDLEEGRGPEVPPPNNRNAPRPQR